MLPRRLKNQGKRILRSLFEAGQHLGIDILPRHFYSEIPNIHELRKSKGWREPLSFSGICADIGTQIAFVDQNTAPFRKDLTRRTLHNKALEINGTHEGFGPIETGVLYCFVRKHHPSTIVQVGCYSQRSVSSGRGMRGTSRILSELNHTPQHFLKTLAIRNISG